jgi:predicted ATPase
VGNPEQQFAALFGMWTYHLVQGEHDVTYSLAELLATLASETQTPALQVEAQWASGCSLFFLGEFSLALQNFEHGAALAKKQAQRPLTVQYGQDPEISCLCYGGITRWCLGYPEQAVQQCETALIVARSIAHPFSLAWALTNSAILYLLSQEWTRVLELASEGMALCKEHSIPVLYNSCDIFRHFALFLQGRQQNDIASIQERLASYRKQGHQMYVPWDYTLLAEACRQANQTAEGFVLLTEAFTAMEKTKEGFYEAEMYRTRGELFLSGQPSEREISSNGHGKRPSSTPSKLETEAENAFLKALDIAQRQQAKLFELRAATSLARVATPRKAHSNVDLVHGRRREQRSPTIARVAGGTRLAYPGDSQPNRNLRHRGTSSSTRSGIHERARTRRNRPSGQRDRAGTARSPLYGHHCQSSRQSDGKHYRLTRPLCGGRSLVSGENWRLDAGS